MAKRQPIFEQGKTCWRVARAERAAVLIDAAAYFSALRAAILAAKRSIFIVGWDIDSRVRLVGEAGAADDGAPEALRDLLIHAVERRPDLAVHLLLWDYSVAFAAERDALPRLNLSWTTPSQIEICLDGELPAGASHHQKIVVIDDTVAFCGGLDVTVRRWDTPAHGPGDPHRVDPSGASYAPFHDAQMMVDGDAAQALGEFVRARWHRAADRHALDIRPTGDPWPKEVRPAFTAIDVAIARTMPEMDGQEEVREVKALYLASIAAAERFIYIENQYLTAETVAEALIGRLGERPNLEVVIVGPRDPDGWLEAKAMGAGRLRFVRRLAEAGVDKQVRLLHPAVCENEQATPIMVHAKIMVIDDTVLRVGSSNLNNRSMGLDSECDLAVEAEGEEQRAAISGLRNCLLAEHLGAEPNAVAEALDRDGSLFRTIDSLTGAQRYLAPVDCETGYDDAISDTIRDLVDSERPVRPDHFVGDMFGGRSGATARKRWLTAAAAVFVLAALVTLWHFSPPAS